MRVGPYCEDVSGAVLTLPATLLHSARRSVNQCVRQRWALHNPVPERLLAGLVYVNVGAVMKSALQGPSS